MCLNNTSTLNTCPAASLFLFATEQVFPKVSILDKSVSFLSWSGNKRLRFLWASKHDIASAFSSESTMTYCVTQNMPCVDNAGH